MVGEEGGISPFWRTGFASEDLERRPCERCGAATIDEAGEKCRPNSDPSGEFWCPCSEATEDVDGYFLAPNAAQTKADASLAAWVDEEVRKMKEEDHAR